MEETTGPGGIQQPAASHWQILSHKIVPNTSLLGKETHNCSDDRQLGTDCMIWSQPGQALQLKELLFWLILN